MLEQVTLLQGPYFALPSAMGVQTEPDRPWRDFLDCWTDYNDGTWQVGIWMRQSVLAMGVKLESIPANANLSATLRDGANILAETDPAPGSLAPRSSTTLHHSAGSFATSTGSPPAICSAPMGRDARIEREEFLIIATIAAIARAIGSRHRVRSHCGNANHALSTMKYV
jgi:hypothetical protein